MMVVMIINIDSKEITSKSQKKNFLLQKTVPFLICIYRTIQTKWKFAAVKIPLSFLRVNSHIGRYLLTTNNRRMPRWRNDKAKERMSVQGWQPDREVRNHCRRVTPRGAGRKFVKRHDVKQMDYDVWEQKMFGS